MIEGISWPSLGIAGGAIGILLTMLVWLIKRQASGAWMTSEQHAAEVARIEAEREAAIARALAAAAEQVATERRIAAEWRETAHRQEVVIGEQATALRQSTETNKLMDILLRNATMPPKAGDNGPREGVATT